MKNKKIAIAIGIIIFALIIIILIFIPKKSNEKTPVNNNESFKYITESGYDVSGKWYSYHNKDSRVYELDLKKDGSFTSTWLEKGSYLIEKEKITLTDTYGLEKSLELRPEETKSEVILFFDNKNHSFTYYRTEEELKESNTKTEEELEEMDKLYNSAINQILVTGDWVDNSGDTTLVFTENEYTATYKSSINNKEETVTNKYEILEYQADNNTYKMKWNVTDKDGLSHVVNDVVITIKNDNEYYLTSFSFPFATSYSKNLEIILEQPCEDIPDNVATEDDYREAEGNNSNPTDNIIRRTIIDNPERDYEAIFKQIEKELQGTWKGSFGDNVINDTELWYYTFTDNKYTFKNKDREHKGTYSLKHHKDNNYHSTLILNPDKEEPIEYDFYLAGNEIITLNFKDNNYPVFLKQ